MKRFLFFLILLAGLGGNTMAQDANLTSLLNSYYSMKDNLVAGKSAAAPADSFIRYLNTVDYKVISEGNIHILLKDATSLSQTTDVAKQRVYFSNLSSNVIAIMSTVKIGTAPVYKVYCPMKKAYWLSAVNEVKNPYYGSAMLTCGKVVETLNQ